ncbi:DUF2625 family protein [Bradyrhizobium genosp. L]|uniref:DUF2625 family protein n=1 Tax=Bradyrhizobium genosp. L TaxID=83637 RepID=UPI0018A250C9|nr:DUF2625 family protein [Bradyrhizobium genosp. L]QPF82679.1 DUF2625 family protein [Bradyrhizobium genosp. L]
MRSLDELINRDEPGIAVVREWAGRADGNGAVFLEPDRALAEASLLRLQVTTRSLLGAIVYETGGILVDDGLLRLLGSAKQRSLLDSNRAAGLLGDGTDARVLLIADDALGGLFALNGGGFGPENVGEVFHLAADASEWSALGVGHSDFVSWCLLGDLLTFYGPLASLDAFKRRPRPPITQVYSFYPYLWSKEGKDRPDVRVISAEDSARARLDISGLSTA